MTVLLRTVARVLFVPGLMLAAALLVKGYAEAGDGFSAGAVAGLAIALQYLAFGRVETEVRLPIRHLRWATPAGLLIALGVTLQSVVRGEAPLTHAPAPGAEVTYLGSLELTTALLFDVGIALIVLGFVITVVHAIDSDLQGRRA